MPRFELGFEPPQFLALELFDFFIAVRRLLNLSVRPVSPDWGVGRISFDDFDHDLRTDCKITLRPAKVMGSTACIRLRQPTHWELQFAIRLASAAALLDGGDVRREH